MFHVKVLMPCVEYDTISKFLFEVVFHCELTQNHGFPWHQALYMCCLTAHNPGLWGALSHVCVVVFLPSCPKFLTCCLCLLQE